jgi:membrane protein
MMGQQSAEILQTAIKSASGKSAGVIGSVLGILTLLITASGVFGEMQSALNAIWKTKSQGGTVTRLLRARAASFGLVTALGFLLLVSLVVSALLTAFGGYVNEFLPFGKFVLAALNFLISFSLITILFAAIYKVLPDTRIEWRDVIVGSIATALLFVIGKSLIGMYIGSTAIASSYGAAGGLVVLLLWIYYSAQVFLVGAEFTRVYALREGSKQNVGSVEQAGSGKNPEPISVSPKILSPLTYTIAGVAI